MKKIIIFLLIISLFLFNSCFYKYKQNIKNNKKIIDSVEEKAKDLYLKKSIIIKLIIYKDYPKALNLLKKIIKNNPLNIYFLRKYIEILKNINLQKKIKKKYILFLKKTYKNNNFINKYIKTYIKIILKYQNKQKKQRKSLIKLIKTTNFPIFLKKWIYLDIAQISLNIYDYKKAKKYLQKTKKLLKNNLEELYITYAWYYLKKFNWDKAYYYSQEAYKINPSLIEPYLFEIANLMMNEDYIKAIESINKIKILFPKYKFSNSLNLALYRATRKECIKLFLNNKYKTGLRLLNKLLKKFPNTPSLLTLKSYFLYKIGKYKKSLISIKKSYKLDPFSLKTVQLYRKFLIKQGKYIKAYKIWKKIVPKFIIYSKNNIIRDKFIKLNKIFYKIKQKKPKNKKNILKKLARCLEEIGWEQEALIIYKKINDKNNILRLYSHLKFIKALRYLIYNYYDNLNLNIVDIIDKIKKLSLKFKINISTYPSKELKTSLLFLKEINLFNPRKSTIEEYLLKYNKILTLEDNYGYIDVRLMNILSIQEKKIKINGKIKKYKIIIGDETYINTYLGYTSGYSDVAGKSFLSRKGFYVALDTIRPNIYILKDIQSLILKEKKDYNEENIINFPYKNMFPYSYKLSLMLLKYAFKNISKKKIKKIKNLYNQIIKREIENVQNHELGHVRDFYNFLPFYKNIGNIIRMIFLNNFSPSKIQTRFEFKADIFGVSHTNYPYYYLHNLLERINISQDDIFELVYWAWYGTPPYKDPYILTSSKIFKELKKYLKKDYNLSIDELFFLSKEKLKKILLEIYKQYINY